MTDSPLIDPLEFRQRWRVRTYEVDENGHVNNAVYLQWAEHLTAEHAEAVGFGREWSIERGGVRGRRHTEIRLVSDATLLAEVASEWVWVRIADGRPARVPVELVAAFSRR